MRLATNFIVDAVVAATVVTVPERICDIERNNVDRGSWLSTAKNVALRTKRVK